MPASWSATRSASIMQRLLRRPTRQLGADEENAIAALAKRRLAARAGRAHRRRQGVLEPAAARRCRDAGAAAGNRNRRRGGARGDRCGRAARANAAHRRPRHRQRGAHLLALLSELPNAFGVGTDASTTALVVARDNARRLGLIRAKFVACDMAAALRGPFDADRLQSALHRVRRHRRARAGGARFRSRISRSTAEPTDLISIAPSPRRRQPLLAPGGVLVVELGIGQAEPVAAFFAAAGLAPSPPRPDLNGMPRALVAWKRA